MKKHAKTIIVPCAGRGARLGCSGSKSMLRVQGLTILHHIVDYWREECEKWYIILSPEDVETATIAETLGINFEIVIQDEPRGIGDALLRASEKINDPFTVVLGDCFLSGFFEHCELDGSGIGVWRQAEPEDVTRNYGVLMDKDEGDRIVRVVEKPADASGMKCGMGVYFLLPGIFSAIRNTPPDAAGTIQITSALQSLIDSGEPLVPVPFDGGYVNINDRSDLARAEKLSSNERYGKQHG